MTPQSDQLVPLRRRLEDGVPPRRKAELRDMTSFASNIMPLGYYGAHNVQYPRPTESK
jgi:hypothetical protein